MKYALIVVLAVAACHPKRNVLHAPETGDKRARARFEQAVKIGDAAELEHIATEFPTDPIVPWAELEAGKAAIKARDFADADAQLTKIEANELQPRRRFLLGITKNYEGQTKAALELLAGAGEVAQDEDERTEYLAALAYSTAAERPLASLVLFDQLWTRVSPTERALILARLEGLVAAADPNALARVYDEISDRRGPSIAVVGSRLVLIKEGNGDSVGGQHLRTDIAPVRVAVGLPRTISEAESGPAKGGAGDPGLVGAVLPLDSTKYTKITEPTVEGLAYAAGASGSKGVVAVETRAASDASASAAMVDQLVRQNVVAIVGPLTDKSVDAAAGRAEGLQVPLLSLAVRAEGRSTGKFVFHLRHSPQSRARVLARRAMAKGLKTFAILAPDTEYGKAAADAFAEVVEKAGGKIVARAKYPDDTTSFAKVAKLDGDWQGVFVPDTAEKLGLIAPSLAAAGTVPKPVGTKKLKGGRPVLLLSTAEDLKDSFLSAVGPHAEGALLAPGFYPDPAEPAMQAFIDGYQKTYGHPPGAFAAYAYDAAQLAAAAGASGRVGLASALANGQLAGVTGPIRFDPDHQRADEGIVYTVVQETAGFAIRVYH